MSDALLVAVTIRAIDAISGPTRRMSEQMARLRSQTGQTEESIARLESRMKKFKNMTLVGAGVTLAGIGLAKGLMDSVDAAGRLQTKMLNVQSALKLNNSELQKATQLAQTVGIPTMWSSEQMSGIMQTMANSGLSKGQVLNSGVLKNYASFAEIQNRKNGTDPNESVAAAVGMAHQYQMYSSKQLSPFLNTLNAALLHSNDTPSEFATTFKYISQQSRLMGMSATQTLSATAWMDRMGLGKGRGGTHFQDFLKRSIYGSSGKKADAAMVSAGFVRNGHSVFTDKKGNFVGIQKAAQILQNFSARFGNNANKTSPLLQTIFGGQGGSIAQVLMKKGASEQYTNVQKQMVNTASIKATQERLNKSWEGQTNQFKTTLKDIEQVFGKGLMNMFLPALTGLNKLLAKVLEFAQAHKKIVGYIATFAAIAAAILLVVGPLMLLTGAFGFLTSSGMIGMALKAIGSSFVGMLGPITTVVAASYLLYQAWTHDWGGIQEKTKGVLNWLKKEFNQLKSLVDPTLKALGFETTTTQTKVMHGALSAPTQQVKSFRLPNWVKWGAGILVAVKGVTGLLGVITKIIGPFNAITRLIGSGGTLISGLMRFGSLILRVTGLTKLWTAAQAVLNVLMDMNPIGLIILGITALIGVTALVVTHWKQVCTWLQKAWSWFKHLGTGVQTAIALILPIIGIPALIIAHWGAISSFFVNLVKEAKNWGSNMISGIWNGMKAMGSWLKSNILSFITSVVPAPLLHLFGISGGSSGIVSPGAKSSGSTTIHIHPGAIQVNGSKNSKQTAKEVVSQMGNLARSNNMSRSLGPNSLIFNGG